MKSESKTRKSAAKKLLWSTIATIVCVYILSLLFPGLFPGLYTKGGAIVAAILWVMINVDNFYQLFTGKNFFDLL